VADVQPFPGLRYNLERIGDLSAVISPPYDVISPEEQQLYYRRSPYNVIRLEHGEERPGDSPQDNKYLRAAATLREWLEEGILVKEERPAFYLVQHSFPFQDTLRTRWGLMARVRLEELGTGSIRLHEMTMREPARDRLALLRACQANFSPVMGLFRHRRRELPRLFAPAIAQPPSMSATDSYGVTYSIRLVSDEDTVARVRRFFAAKTIYIADGHHRYETALAYSKEQSARRSPAAGEGSNFILMNLADAADPDLVMLSTHRLVRGIEADRMAHLEAEFEACFHLELLPPRETLAETLTNWFDALQGQRGVAFGLYGLHKGHLCLLAARDQRTLSEMMPPIWPELLRSLDVSILHWVVLRGMLGIDSVEKQERCLDYTRDGLEALARVDSGEYQLAFFLNRCSIASILAVADAGFRVPQKSTYFYPKTPTGLVINPL